MQCLILAGGLGTRVASATGGLPKALLQFGDRKFIELQLEWLARIGITEAVLALGSGSDSIRESISTSPNRDLFPKIKYSIDGSTLLGTGGAIRKALPFLEENFLVTYGDTFLFVPVEKLFAQHMSKKSKLTLCIYKNSNQDDKSNVRYLPGVSVVYNKTAPSTDMEYIDYGMCAVNRELLGEIPSQKFFDFSETLSSLSSNSELDIFEIKHRFYEVGSLEGIAEFRNFLLQTNGDLNQIQKTFLSTKAL